LAALAEIFWLSSLHRERLAEITWLWQGSGVAQGCLRGCSGQALRGALGAEAALGCQTPSSWAGWLAAWPTPSFSMSKVWGWLAGCLADPKLFNAKSLGWLAAWPTPSMSKAWAGWLPGRQQAFQWGRRRWRRRRRRHQRRHRRRDDKS